MGWLNDRIDDRDIDAGLFLAALIVTAVAVPLMVLWILGVFLGLM